MKNTYILILFLALGSTIFAQSFELSAEIRPRFEYRHGFNTLMVDSLNAAAFVSQRTRLNFEYTSEKIKAYVSLQDVRVWGDVSTLNTSDANGIAIHQAYAELMLSSEFSLKFGRQEISYDDQRIFGSVGWAQQARSHDALLAIYRPNEKNHFELGLALNAESKSLFENDYTLNNYKSLQYIWYHLNLRDFSISLLALNNGFAYDNNGKQDIDYSQTFGTHAIYEKNKISANASMYIQTGKIQNQTLSAYDVSINGYYKFENGLKPGLGFEYLSGTDMNSTNSSNNSFNPLYGTNHKFNGLMDYFYVGNHINSVGLLDVNATLEFKKDKFTAILKPHIFSSAATVVNTTGAKMDNYLGTEIDLTLSYNWIKGVNFQAGYSQMIATETMQVLKGGNYKATNNWAWLMITVKPNLFKTTFKS